MPEKKVGTSSDRPLDQTFVPDQATIAGPAEAKAKATVKDNLDATFVPGSTTVPATHATQSPSNPAGQKENAMSGSPPKKSSNQLGKYKLLKKLGQGGMGEVFLGEDTKLGRKAAIKVLSKALAGKEDFVKRFYKEAKAMARVNHDNAVSVYDVDQDRNIHYVAMEFIDGKSMQKWMDSLGQLSIGDAVHVTLRCAEALQFAHAQNLIHRDIKPDNIMLTSRGKVKVADFGLAKATDEDLSMTASGTGLGTPFYMAPEQARNAKHVDGRADIYALGVTLYYFLTGKLPFGGNSTVEVITAKERGRYESVRKLNPNVTDRLDLIIGKMIDKDPERRCKDCAEVIQLLANIGCESPSLSFIDTPDRVVQSATSHVARSSQSTMTAPQRAPSTGGVPQSSAQDAAAHSKPPSDADAWIVQFRNQQGKETIGKFTTAQIHTAFRTGMLDPKCKLKKSAHEQFVPIGFFPEFEKEVESRNIKQKAELKSAGLKDEFAKIGRQYDRRGLVRWLKGFASGTVGMVKLILWLAFVFGGLAGLIIYRAQLWDAFANFYNSTMQK